MASISVVVGVVTGLSEKGATTSDAVVVCLFCGLIAVCRPSLRLPPTYFQEFIDASSSVQPQDADLAITAPHAMSLADARQMLNLNCSHVLGPPRAHLMRFTYKASRTVDTFHFHHRGSYPLCASRKFPGRMQLLVAHPVIAPESPLSRVPGWSSFQMTAL